MSVSFTALGGAKSGFLSSVAAGAPQQYVTSQLYWNAGETISNSAVVATDDSGAFQVYAYTSVQLLIDVQGYFSTTTGTTSAGGFVPLPNGGTRILDSRVSGSSSGHINPGQTYTISAETSASGVPNTATAVIANVTIISYDTNSSHVTVWPAGSSMPNTSLNYVGGQTTALAGDVGVSSAGQFSLYLGAGATNPVDIVVDLQGYYTSSSTPGAFTAQTARVYDSRATSARIQPGTVTKIQIASLGGIPATGSGGVAAEAVNLEAISHTATDDGYLRLWGTSQSEPTNSDINIDAGATRSNLATVVPGPDNSIWVRYAGYHMGPIDLVIDAEGWYLSSSAASVPGAPQSATATASDSTATVSFNPPSSDGGAQITSYTVTASPNGQSVSSTGSPIVISGLTNGTAYTFTVTAMNSAGTGAGSSPTNAVTPRPVANAPGAPRSVQAVGGDQSAVVSFSPPSSNGGSPITSYTVTSSPGGKTASGAASPITVNGLSNDSPYTFTVTASNRAGTGAASAPSNRVIPESPAGGGGGTTNYSCLNSDHCWGVDTVDKVGSQSLSDINNRWGRNPDFVGQYLNGRDSGVTSLTKSTGDTLHNHGVGVLVIADEGVCSDSSTGSSFALHAANAANQDGIPVNKGNYIFLDVEQADNVTDNCIISFVRDLNNHGYEAGFYENPDNGDFPGQYCNAASSSSAVAAAYLWSSEPGGTGLNTTASGSPAFNPDKIAACTDHTVAWQYALPPGKDFNYDEDEIMPNRLSMLW